MLQSRSLCRAVASVLTVAVTLGVLGSTSSWAAGAREATGATGATGAAGAAVGARPDFQLPFPCGQTWRLDTWAHAPALDMVREPDQEGTEGNPLLAPAAGTVVESFRHDNAGEVIQIDHGGGWFTTYLHLQARTVAEGDDVTQGQEIGAVGRTGPTANNHPHLHFELAVDEDGDGSATWGFEGAERVRPWFAGVEYGQSDGDTWRNVESGNCGGTAETTTTTAPAPTTTAAPPTTAPPSTTTTVAPTTTVPATVTTVAPSTTTTRAMQTGSSSGGTLPLTGTSTTTVAAVLAGALLLVGSVLLLVTRRHRARREVLR